MPLTILAAFLFAPRVVVCIDPGHPSEVGSGSRGRHATEIEVVWRVGKDLESVLRRDGFAVVLTKRREQERVTNRRRAEIANDAHAALMLRLHCDAGSGSGFAVFYPDRPGHAHGVTGPAEGVRRLSETAARRIHDAMAAELRGSLSDDGLKTDFATEVGSHQGALTGSVFSRVPVALVEMVVLTNPRDEAFILSRAGERLMVLALARGVETACGNPPPSATGTKSR